MKGGNGGGGGSFQQYAVAVCLFAVVFGCLAFSAQCLSSHQVKVHTRGLFVSTIPTNRSSYHTEIICPADAAVDDDDERKLKLIFCTVKCYCHGNHDECYCCQLKQGSSDPPVCYDKLDDCKANCPICNPECPPATAADFLA